MSSKHITIFTRSAADIWYVEIRGFTPIATTTITLEHEKKSLNANVTLSRPHLLRIRSSARSESSLDGQIVIFSGIDTGGIRNRRTAIQGVEKATTAMLADSARPGVYEQVNVAFATSPFISILQFEKALLDARALPPFVTPAVACLSVILAATGLYYTFKKDVRDETQHQVEQEFLKRVTLSGEIKFDSNHWQGDGFPLRADHVPPTTECPPNLAGSGTPVICDNVHARVSTEGEGCVTRVNGTFARVLRFRIPFMGDTRPIHFTHQPVVTLSIAALDAASSTLGHPLHPNLVRELPPELLPTPPNTTISTNIRVQAFVECVSSDYFVAAIQTWANSSLWEVHGGWLAIGTRQ